jgi:glycosyltransferase involved in cell wall biosynthesis
MGLDKCVFFLDVKPDVYRYLCAADCYIMPSLYEGLPVAAIEAECSGLPCVFSTNITKEVALTENVAFLKLSDPVEKWVDCIIHGLDVRREDCSDTVRASGYDMQDVALRIENFYMKNIL